jgi:hypothetical protein
MAITDVNTNLDSYEIEVFNNVDCENFHFENNQNLKILYFNARSIKSGTKLAEIDCFLKDLKCEIHVIVISETWVQENEKSFYNIPNYVSIYSCRKTRIAGGIGIFIHENLKYKELFNYCDEIISYVTIELLFNNSSLKITGFYRPPDMTSDLLDAFYGILQKSFDETSNGKSMYFGDFNINLMNENEQSVIEYLSIVNSNGYFVCDPNTVTRPAAIQSLTMF